jgi:hypothetical protein
VRRSASDHVNDAPGPDGAADLADLCAEVAYPHSYASVRRYVQRLERRHPKLVDVMEHPPGEEGQVDFFQGPPTFEEGQGRWRRPWIFRLTLSCSKYGYPPCQHLARQLESQNQ